MVRKYLSYIILWKQFNKISTRFFIVHVSKHDLFRWQKKRRKNEAIERITTFFFKYTKHVKIVIITIKINFILTKRGDFLIRGWKQFSTQNIVSFQSQQDIGRDCRYSQKNLSSFYFLAQRKCQGQYFDTFW